MLFSMPSSIENLSNKSILTKVTKSVYPFLRSLKPHEFAICIVQVDHMVGLAKDGSLHARRQALSYIYDKELVHALFEQVRFPSLLFCFLFWTGLDKFEFEKGLLGQSTREKTVDAALNISEISRRPHLCIELRILSLCG
jgi:hypothetical protein